MILLVGKVSSGYGVATPNLAHVISLIEGRTGLSPLVPGTLNLQLAEPYIVAEDARIEIEEYDNKEFIKLQRCRINSVRGIIMRPHLHESGSSHGPAYLEIMAKVKLRDYLHLKDGDEVKVEVSGDETWWQRA